MYECFYVPSAGRRMASTGPTRSPQVKADDVVSKVIRSHVAVFHDHDPEVAALKGEDLALVLAYGEAGRGRSIAMSMLLLLAPRRED